MLTKLAIQGLRGLTQASLNGLAPVTVLLGPNGSRKTTVLEACGVLAAGRSGFEAWSALLQREWLGVEGLRYIVPLGGVLVTGGLDTTVVTQELTIPDLATVGPFTTPLTLWATWQGDLRELAIDADGLLSDNRSEVEVPYEFVHSFVDRAAGARQRLNSPSFSSALRVALSAIKLSPLFDDWLDYLRELRPGIASIESISVGDRDEPFVFEREGKRARTGFPLAFAGDGFRRSLLLAGAFARAKAGIVAIDEPEAFAHPTLFRSVAQLIQRGLADDTQVIMATHSLEFVGALLDEFADDLEKVAIFGLSVSDGKLDAVRIPGGDAQKRVHELGHDLRL